MKKVIDFSEARKVIAKLKNHQEKQEDVWVDLEKRELDYLLKRAVSFIADEKEKLLKKNSFQKNSLILGQEGSLFFEKKINEEILRRKIVESGVFLCGIYVSKVLANLAKEVPQSWWAVDYIETDNSYLAQKGGDVCFVVCSVFPERGNWRLMKFSYYESMGKGFYQKCFSLSRKGIFWQMSQNFETMAEVTRAIMKEI